MYEYIRMYNNSSKHINSFATDNTRLCGRRFYPVEDLTMHVVPKKHLFGIFLKLRSGRFRILKEY